MRIPPRLATSSLLVLLVLGGASLAVAADTTNLQPALPPAHTSPAVQMQPDLAVLDAATADLAQAARDSTANLQALDLDATRAALARGDAASARVSGAILTLGAQGTGVAAATEMTDTWLHMRPQTSTVVALLSTLQAHDADVLNATAKGRLGDWSEALDYLNDASAWLAQAQLARPKVGDAGAAATLGQLIDRDAAYDAALNGLYSFMAKGRDQSGRKFTALSKAVADAQAGLPASNGVLSLIVGESAGATLYGDLLNMERGRSQIAAAIGARQ